MIAPQKRLLQLDALRAFAILGVLVEHWAGEIREFVPIGGGTLGVQLFFTLSGFLITGILLEDIDRRRRAIGAAIFGFYIRRVCRLVPAYYSWLLILALLGIGGIAQSWPWHAAYLSNVYMARGGSESVLWTLAVEEQFYLLWPLVLIATPRRWLVPVAAGMIVAPLALKLLLLGFDGRMSFYLLPWQIDVLGAGCLLAILSYRNDRKNQFEWFTPRRLWVLGVAGVTCFLMAAIDWHINRGGLTRYLFVNPLCSVFFAWLVIMTARGWRGRIGLVFDNAILQYIGRVSYGIYLVHNWMPDIVEKLLGPLPKYQAAPIVVALTFGVCALSWRFLERPFIRWGHHLSNNLAGRQREAVSG